MQYAAVLLVLMLVGLVIYFALSPGQNLFTDLYESLATKQSLVTVYQSSAGVRYSGSYNYVVTASARMKINQPFKEETPLIAVISFKGVDYKDESTNTRVLPGETGASYDTAVPARITSNIPPIAWIGDGSSYDGDNIVEGQEFSAGGSNDKPLYRITMDSITSGCGTSFTVECKSLTGMQTKSQIGLKKCRHTTDPECIADFRICGGEVRITQSGDIDCDQRKADGVRMSITDNGRPWIIKDTVVLSFFRRTPCVEKEDDLERMKKNCGSMRDGRYDFDFLGNVNIPVDVASG